ncbi:MAG: chemoreceptor glutamine deamidase CheD [Reinekea forsetii]|nr:chemoreceptor glutamine deamidase CheD [Reinekea forsetii]MDO7673580.1 chemoreceptor glutamine deamidase CheD [Reinekea forsetii]
MQGFDLNSFDLNNNHLAPNRYFDRHFDQDAVKILPGEYFATRDNTLIVTVLGSCVSVCLSDAKLKIGGMNHFLLPNDSSVNHDILGDSARYGGYAMEILINHMLKLGARRSSLVAKIFGGGNVLRGITATQVGQRNANFVQDYLKTERIAILASDLLENYPRKVYFFPATGKVFVRKLKSMHNSTILDRESAYRLRIGNTPIMGDIELFGE